MFLSAHHQACLFEAYVGHQCLLKSHLSAESGSRFLFIHGMLLNGLKKGNTSFNQVGQERCIITTTVKPKMHVIFLQKNSNHLIILINNWHNTNDNINLIQPVYRQNRSSSRTFFKEFFRFRDPVFPTYDRFFEEVKIFTKDERKCKFMKSDMSL